MSRERAHTTRGKKQSMSIVNLEQTVIEYQQAGQEWIEAKLKADQLEEDSKNFLASLMNDFERSSTEKFSEAKLDRWARGTKEYRNYIAGMCAARAEMLRKKVRFDALGMLFESRRSELSYEKEQIAKGIFHTGGR
jgi:hypothetical protein